MGGAMLVLLLLCAVSGAAPLRPLPEAPCVNRVVELEVGEARVNVDGIVSFNTRLYHLNGVAMFPGPTVVMRAGSWCTLRVVNRLAGERCGVAHRNDYHCPNTTNLHTHGLHVSPNEDDIDTHINPGEAHDYTYTVHEDHLMGTHWYHAHHHGSTSLHAMGGMAGVLLVEPSPGYPLPADLDVLYREAPPPLLLSHVNLGGSDPLAGRSIFSFFDQEGLEGRYERPMDLRVEWSGRESETEKSFYVVNGQYAPEVVVRPVTLLRFVHATGTRQITLGLDGDCDMELVARDGVFHRTPYLQLSSIILFPGTRADVSIRCRSERVRVYSSATMQYTPSLTNSHVQDVVMTLVVEGSGLGDEGRHPTGEAPLPGYLDSLLDVPDVHYQGETGVSSISFSQRISGEGRINGVAFPGWDAGRYVEEYCLDETYQVTLGAGVVDPDGPVLSSLPPHPYHQHVNHFQIVDAGGDDAGNAVRVGEWRDVAPAWGVKMRFRPVHYVGEVVLHCHLTQHEDRGMMGLMKISPCPPSQPSLLSPSRKSIAMAVCVAALACLAIAVAQLRRPRVLPQKDITAALPAPDDELGESKVPFPVAVNL